MHTQQNHEIQEKADADGAAISSLIMAFFIPPVAVILGHVSRSQAKRKGLIPSGVATAGLVLGYIFSAFMLIMGIAIGITVANANSPTQQYINCINDNLNNGTNNPC